MIQVYMGDGKGKTTAALGLCLRAAGAGLRVFFGQFLKKGNYSEIAGLKKLATVTVEQFGTGFFIRHKPGRKEVSAAKKGLARAKNAAACGKFDLIILDEFNLALRLGLIGRKEADEFLSGVPEKVELVLTGRGADSSVLKHAGLVSDIREIKHYYRSGRKARKGIEF